MKHCVVINLEDWTERMEFMASQLEEMGLAFTRIDAVKPDAASRERDEAYWQSWERPMKDTECACLLSHVMAWRMIAATGEPMLVLEDDAVLSRRLPDILSATRSLAFIDHCSFETRGRRKLMARDEARGVHGHGVFRLYQDRSGAAAYLLRPAGARKLLANAQARAGLADAVICRSYELRSYQLDPACAVQTDRSAEYGVTVPIQTSSAISSAPQARFPRRPAHRMRRIGAQLQMGFQRLRHPLAQLRHVGLRPEDFTGGQA